MFEDITDKDIAQLKKGLEYLKKRELDGDVRGTEFIGGPHDGAKMLCNFLEGEPSSMEVSLSLDNVFVFEEKHDAAYYRWNKRKGKYVFNHIGERVCHKDGDNTDIK